MKTGTVIVAAGMSSRMKAFKPLLPLSGSTIIGTAIATLQAAGIQDIAVVTGNGAEKLEQYLSATGVTCLYNEQYETTDMFSSAKIGLGYQKDRCDRVFFLPGDVPLFSRQSLVSMQNDMNDSRCEILLPVHKGKMGHPILLNSNAIPFLTDYRGGGGLKGALDSFSGLKRIIELNDVGMTLDADRPEDYEQLKAYVRRRSDGADTADV
ncbi:MAG TPA: nucleotidyltransferase family protein [Clostridia bacterium]|nr:nucleotidyltransferase family protein [Clostridia bacterium]